MLDNLINWTTGEDIKMKVLANRMSRQEGTKIILTRQALVILGVLLLVSVII